MNKLLSTITRRTINLEQSDTANVLEVYRKLSRRSSSEEATAIAKQEQRQKEAGWLISILRYAGYGGANAPNKPIPHDTPSKDKVLKELYETILDGELYSKETQNDGDNGGQAPPSDETETFHASEAKMKKVSIILSEQYQEQYEDSVEESNSIRLTSEIWRLKAILYSSLYKLYPRRRNESIRSSIKKNELAVHRALSAFLLLLEMGEINHVTNKERSRLASLVNYLR